jgi:type I protein arginine methyltransferase
MPLYETAPTMRYAPEEVWFAASLYILSWEEDFHDLMLNDQIRMEVYEKAIKTAVRPGMAVLDLGTGTGILAQWALEAGARVVYGIDVNEAIIPRALERMAAAGFADRFQVFNALSHQVSLPEKVDLLISEILGNMADNEGMVAILNDARPRFLGERGRMLPARATSFLVPVAAARAHAQVESGQCRGLSRRYDLRELLQSLGVASPFNIYFDVIIPAGTYLAQPAVATRLAFEGDDPEEYSRELVFPVQRDGLLTGFKGYFVAELTEGVVLDISGDDIAGRRTSDSWKHCYLPIERPAAVRTGDQIELTFARGRPRQTSPFQQRYRWSGRVRRGEQTIASFDNGMD